MDGRSFSRSISFAKDVATATSPCPLGTEHENVHTSSIAGAIGICTMRKAAGRVTATAMDPPADSKLPANLPKRFVFSVSRWVPLMIWASSLVKPAKATSTAAFDWRGC